MNKTKCPICEKEYHDILKHLVIIHEIQDLNHYKTEIENIEDIKKKQHDFSDYVTMLKDQRAKGLITAEDYRRLVTEWFRKRR